MKNLITKFVILLSLLLFVTISYSQTGVGKLSGKISDITTQEALIGANVIIVGTQSGAATNVDGEYFILNITPGTYSIKVTYVGYAPKTIENVRIVAGITFDLNIELSTDFSLDEIIVIDRKFFEKNSTGTTKVIDADQISRLPVRGVANVASLQSGVVIQEGSGGQDGNATINVRGGRGSEVIYIIDGIPQNNLYDRTSTAQVSNIAIDQISFQVGGYEAKYGQAQSGIINVTTKSGQSHYNVLADVVTSSFTDDFGFNSYQGSISGPIIPGISEHTLFASLERGWFKDGDPAAIDIYFPTTGESYNYTPNNPAEIWRFSGKTTHRIGSFTFNLSGLYNDRVSKVYDVRKLKNDSFFNEEFTEDNTSLSLRVSQTLSNSTFWNLNAGYRQSNFKRYFPEFGDNIELYGDSLTFAERWGVALLGNGQRTTTIDANGVFRPYGYSTGYYEKRANSGLFFDLDLTSQIDNHLMEFGVGASTSTVRRYAGFVYEIAGQPSELSLIEKAKRINPTAYGYDETGQNETDSDNINKLLRPYEPFIGYAYIQDRFELKDLVLNVGLRVDYFDLKSYVLKNPSLPYAGGSNSFDFDQEDFSLRDADVEFSPRIGIGYPVTSSTVFHAQIGRFIQIPELQDMYFGPYDYDEWKTFAPQDGFNGALKAEETMQYEIGFRQLFGNNAALNITAFYKNTKGLVNLQNHFFSRVSGGELVTAIYPENADFGTVKGLSFSFDVTRLSYFGVSAQYTFSIAEGTGSSTSSSQTAIFRNQDNAAPIVIAPLSFDQTNTGLVNIDFFVPAGDLGWLELLNVNALFSFNSGRPYTPTDKWNIIGDNGLGAANTGYINSAYGPSSIRIDLKLEKGFSVGNSMILTPYLWIENLLDSDNAIRVWRSTGDPLTTGWLNTVDGKAIAAQRGEGYEEDYKSIERDPRNFGIPRLIKLGFKMNFSSLGL